VVVFTILGAPLAITYSIPYAMAASRVENLGLGQGISILSTHYCHDFIFENLSFFPCRSSDGHSKFSYRHTTGNYLS